MERNEVIALVAGASIGLGGGAVGALLAWAAGEAAARRCLDQFGDQDIELRQPAPPVAQHAAQQASPDSAPVTQLPSDQSLPNPKETVTSAHAPREP